MARKYYISTNFAVEFQNTGHKGKSPITVTDDFVLWARLVREGAVRMSTVYVRISKLRLDAVSRWLDHNCHYTTSSISHGGDTIVLVDTGIPANFD